MKLTELYYKLRKSLLLAGFLIATGSLMSFFIVINEIDGKNTITFQIPFTGIKNTIPNNSILSDLISGVLSSIAVYWVLDETIKEVFGISELPELPLKQFIQEISSVQGKNIYILETFTDLAIQNHLYLEFSKIIKQVVSEGSKVHILLVHPDSDAARKRAGELSEVNPSIKVPEFIDTTLARFYQLSEEVIAETKNYNNLQIKLYTSNPTIAMHRWGEEAYVSFFPVNQRSDESPNLKLSTVTTFGRYCVVKFEELWNSDSTISLQSYMQLTIINVNNKEKIECCYVYKVESHRRFLYAIPKKNQVNSPLLSSLNSSYKSQLIFVEMEENFYDAILKTEDSQDLNTVGSNERKNQRERIKDRYFPSKEGEISPFNIKKYIDIDEPKIIAIELVMQVDIALNQNQLQPCENRSFYYVYDEHDHQQIYALCNSDSWIHVLSNKPQDVSVSFEGILVTDRAWCKLLDEKINFDKINEVIRKIQRKYEYRGVKFIIDENPKVLGINLYTGL